MTEEALHRGSALRERRRVILLCAPVTLMFTLADTVALQRFSLPVFGVRLAWTALIVATGLLLGRLSLAAERRLVLLLAGSSSAFFALLTWMTGGWKSPLFHWILAMPLVIAVVVQDYPRATLAAAGTTLAGGFAIVLGSGQPLAAAFEWLILAAGMSLLAVYASTAYQRLRFREQALREAAAVAVERARASEEAVRLRDDFLTVASHELRTPLTALRLQAERLKRRGSREGEAERVREETSVGAIHRQIERLTSLVDSLFEMSRLTASGPALQKVPTALSPLLRQAVARYAPIARQEECELTLEVSEEVTADVDGVRLEQVVTNLLANAVKYGRGKPVQVRLLARAGRAVLAVSDQGIGIAADDQRRIFERFERAVSSRQYGGLGLGLWISRRLIEEMGGSITVDSRPGEGATFTIELPLSGIAQPHPAARPN
jgi:signal transduction histidine kinase